MKATLLARAAEAVAARPSYALYERLMAHYSHCHGCAHDTQPCAEGTRLRRAWKAARAS